MSRPAAWLALVVVLMLASARPMGAQSIASLHAIPTSEALRFGVPVDRAGAIGADSVSTVELSMVKPDVDAIINRRRRFAKTGGFCGLAAASAWLIRSSSRNPSIEHVAIAAAMPLWALPVYTLGGAVGYGVSFVFLPPQRVTGKTY